MLSIEHWRQWKRWNVIARRILGVRRRYVVPGCRFAAALLSRYWVRLSKKASRGLATQFRRHCALSTRSIRALTPRQSIEISSRSAQTQEQASRAARRKHASDAAVRAQASHQISFP